MGFTWTAAAHSITALDRRTHYRTQHPGQRPAAGLDPMLCGRVITPSPLVTPIGEDCPDCATLSRSATPRTTAEQPRPNHLGGAARWKLWRTTRTAPPR
jgi:hypothetical protein